VNIRKALHAPRTKSEMEKIASYIGKNPKRYGALMEVLFGDEEKRIRMYAAWTMCHICDVHPSMSDPYWKEMYAHLSRKNLHPTEIRSIVRTWRDRPIPKKWKGKIIDLCFNNLLDEDVDVAVWVYSMTILSGVMEEFPELRNEFIATVESLMEHAKPSMKARARASFKKIGHVSTVIKC